MKPPFFLWFSYGLPMVSHGFPVVFTCHMSPNPQLSTFRRHSANPTAWAGAWDLTGIVDNDKRPWHVTQWVDLKENLQETIDFPMKIMGFSSHFSLKPINWNGLLLGHVNFWSSSIFLEKTMSMGTSGSSNGGTVFLPYIYIYIYIWPHSHTEMATGHVFTTIFRGKWWFP